MTREPLPDTRFNGQWIGETQGYEMPAHFWSIRQRGPHLYIDTHWEDQPPQSGQFYGRVIDEQAAFSVGDGFTATLVDSQHFIIPGWDTNDARDNVGPAYDVVFSRPGVAELLAHAVWRRYRDENPEDAPDEGV